MTTSSSPAASASTSPSPLERSDTAGGSRGGSPIVAVPRPLALLLAVVALFATGWVVVTPAWQSPDEDSHFAYVQTLAENARLPGGERPIRSTEHERAVRATNVDSVIVFPPADPEYSAPAERAWSAISSELPRSDGGGLSPAATYPPLYYAYATVPYLTASSGDIFTRMTVMRLASALWLLVTTVAVWLLAGELFGRRRDLQLVAAATSGLWPMISFVSASVHPDGMLFALWSLAFWRGAVIATRGLTPGRGALFGALVSAAVLVKLTSLALVPPVFGLLAWAAWRERAHGRGGAMPAIAVTVLALAVPVAAWSTYGALADRDNYAQAGRVTAVSGGVNVQEFGSYLWQFYLPRPDFLQEIDHHIPIVSELPVLNTWMGMSWGAFGWVNVWFPRWVYVIFGAITALVCAGWVAAALRWNRRRRGGVRSAPGRAATVAFLTGAAAILVLALHWTDYRLFAQGGGLFAQGRYLFPLVAPGAMVVAVAVDVPSRRARELLSGAWLGGLVVLQLACLGLALSRWYA